MVRSHCALNHRLCSSSPSRSRISSKHAVKRLDRRAVADDHHLRAVGAALHHDLQVTGEPAMDGLGVGSDLRIDERAPHHGRDAVDQWMLHDAVRDVHDSMRAEFEHAEPGRTQAPANGQAGAQSKAGQRTRHHGNTRQAMGAGQRFQRCLCRGSDARLTETRTARAGRAVGAGQHGCGRQPPHAASNTRRRLVPRIFSILSSEWPRRLSRSASCSKRRGVLRSFANR